MPAGRRPRGYRHLLAVAMVAVLAGAPRAGVAQDTTKTSRDSLAARLERAEEAIELLREQLATQASSGVQTRSRLQLELSGRVLTNAFGNSRRVNNVDNPQFVRPDTTGGPPMGGAGMAIRQTTLGLAVNADRMLGGSFRGELQTDFYGGQQPSSGGRTFPLLRIRIATGTVRWTHGALMVGQEQPLVAGVNPASLAGVGTPDFAGAGNLWLWLPQIRGTLETSGALRFGVQGAVLAPTSGDAAGAFDTDVDVAERSRRPYLQGRVRARWGSSDETAGEIGVGVHRGWLATAGDSLLPSEAVTMDALVPIGSRLEVRGEAYTGKALKGLGGGGIGQGTGAGGAPVRDKGGWAQVMVKTTPTLSLGGGCGLDDPEDKDLPASGRLKNQACAGMLAWHPDGPLTVGLEYRRLQTTYAAGTLVNDHVNAGIGFAF
jgi:hypothetical protein